LQREERRVMVRALNELQRQCQSLAKELSIIRGDRIRRVVGDDATPPPVPEVPEFLLAERKGTVASPKPVGGRPRGTPAFMMIQDVTDEDPFTNTHMGEVVTESITTAMPRTAMAWQGDSEDLMSASSMQYRRQLSMLEPAADVRRKLVRKQRLRLRTLLGLSVGGLWVTAEMLQSFLARRYPSTAVDVASIIEVFAELKRARVTRREDVEAMSDGELDDEDAPGKIGFKLLVELILDDDLPRHVQPHMREDVEWFCKALLAVTVDEVIDNATNIHGHDLQDDDDASQRGFFHAPTPVAVIRAIVPVTVLMSIACLGLSLDFLPGSILWLVMEVIFTAIFVTEVVVKMASFGPRGYFCGKERRWNTLDFIVTALSVMDVCISFYLLLRESVSGTAAQVLPLLRALRISRVFRLPKILRIRFLKNFTNMLTGFMLGLPALFGVIVLFCVVLFVLGLAFRIMWGPEDGQDLIGQCGLGDEYLEDGNRTEYCDRYVHYMYGEEFFGTVWVSMFTTFRFMLGDYQSKDGVSLAIVFGEGYGSSFHLLFGVGMICCVFGLFNIVTAIFVDSTISGLKHNDIMRKYAQQYEGRYVKAKLMALIHRVAAIMAEKNQMSRRVSRVETIPSGTTTGRFAAAERTSISRFDPEHPDCLEAIQKLVIAYDDFCEIMEDAHVRALLRDLDVEMYNPQSFFETFDVDDTGVITITAMVQNIIRLRGDVRKNDMIASLVAVRALGKRFDALTLAMGKGGERKAAETGSG